MTFLDRRCGAWQNGTSPTEGSVTFTVFLPTGPNPQIDTITVVGDFQSQLGGANWDVASGLALHPSGAGDGVIWTATSTPLTSDYYQYAYEVVFSNGERRRVADPCARWSGGSPSVSGVVVGGRPREDNVVTPLEQRLPWTDLIIYELMIDDFTADYRAGRAPIDAVVDRLETIHSNGFNAVEFLPWTAWRGDHFDWGYEPSQYFAVERRYTVDNHSPAEHLSRLKRLVTACHRRGMHVIMDGVFNHTSHAFTYPMFYSDPAQCPMVGKFGKAFSGLQELNFSNQVTEDFVVEACTYWIDEFGIDGIRFDAAPYYDDQDEHEPLLGLPRICHRLRRHLQATGQSNFALVLEYLEGDAADAAERCLADGHWDNSLMEAANQALDSGRVSGALLAALNTRRNLKRGCAPCIYLSNHDHSQVLWRVGRGGPGLDGALDRWWRVQPFLIALFTATGVPLVPNGQEVGEEHMIPENDHATRRRLLSRPVRWHLGADRVGATLEALHRRLATMRRDHRSLRSTIMAPANWPADGSHFDPANGLGVDADRQIVLYQRSAPAEDGNPEEHAVVVLNFADHDQEVETSFPHDGTWTDLLAGFANDHQTYAVQVHGSTANVSVGSHWGRVLTSN